MTEKVKDSSGSCFEDGDIRELLDEMQRLERENKELRKSLKDNKGRPEETLKLLKVKYEKVKKENDELLLMLNEFNYDSKLDNKVRSKAKDAEFR